MKKQLGFILGGLLGVFLAAALQPKSADAVTNARSPKSCVTVGYTTNLSSATSFNVWDSTNSVTKPGAVYAVYLSTGASGDYIILLDTNTGTGYTTGAQGGKVPNGQIARLYHGSTSANTQITFDPPIPFNTGLLIGMSASTNQATVCYEQGRGLQGD